MSRGPEEQQKNKKCKTLAWKKPMFSVEKPAARKKFRKKVECGRRKKLKKVRLGSKIKPELKACWEAELGRRMYRYSGGKSASARWT